MPITSLVKSVSLQPVIRRKEVDLRLVPMGFLAIICIGAALLALPWTHKSGQSVDILDAFFVATSATCVTGLTTVNVAQTFNTFGQAVILFLIQTGGIGIFTASISLVLLSGQKLSLSDEQTIRTTVGKLRRVQPLDVFLYACVSVLLFELAGTVALFFLMNAADATKETSTTLWEAAFHSVSAFCNAGFSIYPQGMARWQNNHAILAVIAALVIVGGIGLMTLINLRYYHFWRRDPRRRGQITLQTKIALAMTAILLLAGTLMTLLFELNHTLKDASFSQAISWSCFHSVMSRTAGFNAVDLDQMNPPTLLGTLFLMFIGGSPGSMAGGIKTTTFAVLLITAYSAIRRQENIQIFGRRIVPTLAHTAVMLGMLATAAVTICIGLLMVTEQNSPAAQSPHHWLALTFEAFSAFGTVGLSTGITPLLTAPGKLILVVLMFTGRVAPLILSIYLARPRYPWHIRYPTEEIGLG